MRKLLLILSGLWTAVLIYTYMFRTAPAAGWNWLIFFILIAFGMIGVCIVSGAIGFAKYRNPWPATLINAAGASIAGIILAGSHGSPSRGIVFIGGGAFLITLGAAFIAYVFDGKHVQQQKTQAKDDQSSIPAAPTTTPQPLKHPLPNTIRYPLMAGIFIGLYFLVAYCSQFQLFPAEKELFWKEITPEQNNFQFGKVPEELQEGYMKDRYILDRNGDLFTGAIDRYKPRLRINPFPATVKGVDYYINGEKWGESIETYGVTVPFDYNTHQRIKRITLEESQPPYLIHAFYADNISRLLKKHAGQYIIIDMEDPLEKYLLGFDEDENKILKTHIHYYTNGMISEITYNYNMELEDEEHWGRSYHRIRMDRLGFIDSDSKYGVWDMKWEGTKWKRNDFIYTDVVPDPVQAGVATGRQKEILEEKLIHPTRITLPGNSYSWDDNKAFPENLYGLHGITDTTHLMYRVYSGSKEVEGLEKEKYLDLLHRCNRITTEVMYDKNNRVQNRYSAKVEIRDPDTQHSFSLYYIGGRFVMENNLYSFSIDANE